MSIESGAEQRPSLAVVMDRVFRDPLVDIAIGPAWLRRVAADQSGAVLRIYRPMPTVAFSARDCLAPGIGAAAATAAEYGFAAVRRGPGGRATAYHQTSIGIDHVSPAPRGSFRIHDRFERYGLLLTDALRSLGVDAQLGPVPGEYCPGEFSVNDGRGRKLIGTAQRLVSGGWLFSSMIVVAESAAIRDVLIPVYRRLGLNLNPGTVGAVADSVPDVTMAAMEQALLNAYGAVHQMIAGEMPQSVLDAARGAQPAHRVGEQHQP